MNDLHDVAYTADVFDANGGIGLQILAELRYEYVHASSDEEAIVFPDTFEKDLPFNKAAGMPEEHLEQFRFLVSQLRDTAIGIEGEVIGVKRRVTGFQYRCRHVSGMRAL